MQHRARRRACRPAEALPIGALRVCFVGRSKRVWGRSRVQDVKGVCVHGMSVCVAAQLRAVYCRLFYAKFWVDCCCRTRSGSLHSAAGAAGKWQQQKCCLPGCSLQAASHRLEHACPLLSSTGPFHSVFRPLVCGRLAAWRGSTKHVRQGAGQWVRVVHSQLACNIVMQLASALPSGAQAAARAAVLPLMNLAVLLWPCEWRHSTGIASCREGVGAAGLVAS